MTLVYKSSLIGVAWLATGFIGWQLFGRLAG